ncbi:phage antirepressor KilAC domain-containing protein [Oscillospiraceae bacterium Marseille-Q3528]|nr:phage antirepressor KilAC domain-containing protein [Oscillospiraceae bacterium Marseille-Q3528]
MNELKIFENPEFGAIRTIVIDNEPWFVGNDVSRALGYKDLYSALRHNVDDEDKRLCPVSSTSGTQETMVISESGLYSLIFGSKLEKAKEFKRWVTSEILPSIRKNGGYIQNQEQMTPEQIVANALIVANKIIAEKEAKIVEMKPKAEYFDNLIDSKLLTTFRDTAKELHIPPRQFTQWLIDNKYVYRDRHNMLKPYETHRKSGLFQMKDFSTPFGYSNVQTFVTVKGKETFRLLVGGIDK